MIEGLDFTRMLIAFIVGYALCLSGSLAQLTTNNTLASPSTLGMDGFAVVFVIFSQFAIALGSSLPLEFGSFTLFLISFVGVSFIFLKTKSRGIWRILNMRSLILMGLAFNLMVGAIFSVIQFMFLALNLNFPSSLWFGNFKQIPDYALPIFLLVFLGSLFYVKKNYTKFNIMNLGVFQAQGMGLQVERFQRSNLLLGLLLTGLVICFCGVFSFLGLILPHIFRSLKIFRFDMSKEVLWAPFVGGLSIMVLDLLCYHFPLFGAEIPVGMISSVIGAFLLIFLSLRMGIKQG